jgi:altronate dehydratase small subunit
MDNRLAADPRLVWLDESDNVAVAAQAIAAGEPLAIAGGTLTALAAIPPGHKVAVRAIAAGEKVLKYGHPIGSATRDIRAGEHVHTQNLKSDYLPWGREGMG